MKKYNVELHVATTINESIAANDRQEAVSIAQRKYEKMEASNKLINMKVEVAEIEEDPQMSFDFPEFQRTESHQAMLLFG